jgi:uncharacterized coiled-coil protein SlyX
MSLSPLVSPSEPSRPEGQERLAEQLNTLSQVVETITYRLLELEERLALQESHLHDLQQQTVGSQQLSDGAELRFDDTEERLGRLESLLNGLDSMPAAAGTPRHLQPVTGGAGRYGVPAEEPCIDGPFLEEPEQPFMDEVQEEPLPQASLPTSDSQLDLVDAEQLSA